MRNSRIQFTRKLEFSIKVFTFCLMVLGNVFMSYSQGCPEVPISILDGTNGFFTEGTDSQNFFGNSVKDAGDINGGGVSDIIIGAPYDGSGDQEGNVYVIFGESEVSSTPFDISMLDGDNGFVIRGTGVDNQLGFSVSTAGDFNGDDFDDIIVGVPSSSVGGGKVIVLFGKDTTTGTGFSASYTVSDINPTNGNGVIIEESMGTNFGYSVSYAGDLNDDEVSDIIVSSPGYDTPGFRNNGRTYVIFGSSSISDMNVSSLNGGNGFVINGFLQAEAGLQASVSNVGSINNDAFDDVIMGFPNYEVGGNDVGRVCVLYGRDNFPAEIDLESLSTTDGFSIIGEGTGGALGFSVGPAGDFNENNGPDDFIIGDPRKDVGDATDIGEAYIIYGSSSFPSLFRVSDLNNTNSLTLRGDDPRDNLGFAVDGASDINGDGVSDIIVSSTSGGAGSQGGAFIVFGGTTTSSDAIEAFDIIGSIGYSVFEDTRFGRYRFGHSVSMIEDFNGDMTPDFAVGAIKRYSFGTNSGRAYVFYGETFDLVDAELPTINCPPNQELYANSVLPNYVSFLGDTRDNCTYERDLVFTQTPPQGTIISTDTNVTVSVTDRSGNTNSCNFRVTIKTETSTIECNTSSFPVSHLNGDNGILLYGEKAMGRSGGGEQLDVDTAGDVNGDRIQDFIIGTTGIVAPSVGPYGNERITLDGSAYVVFGTDRGFPPNIDLALLDGSNGFIIRNDTPFTGGHPTTGASVSSAGDINGDGIDDVMVSDPYRNTALGFELGYTHIIFGSRGGFSREFNISSLDGFNGFTIIGVGSSENAGVVVDNLGDVNGDTIDDIAIISAGSSFLPIANSFVVYGTRSRFPVEIRVNELDGSNGFTIRDSGGTSGRINLSAVGNVNGNGSNDIAVGGVAGRNYIIYGRERSDPFPAIFDVTTIDGTNGFTVEYPGRPNLSAHVAKAGSINDDRFQDVVFGNEFVVFGGEALPAIVDLRTLDGTNGFSFDSSVRSVNTEYAGDFNNDGIDDLILNPRNSAYILYGKNNWESTITLTSPSVSVLPIRLDLGSGRNISVSHAGDVNGDMIDDIIIGKYDIMNNFDVDAPAPTIFVVFGQNIPDIDAPNIRTCPGNQTLSSGSPLPDYTGDVDATDDCDTNLEITQDPIAGTLFTADTTVTITVTDNSGKETQCSFDVRTPTLTPTVNLSVSSNTGTETDETIITVRATSSMAVVGDQTIDIGVTGVEITSSDFTLSTTTITIPDGMTMGAVTFTIVDDTVMEGIETAILTISNPSTGITLGRTTTQNVVITDNDSESTPTVNLSASSNTGTEADETIITVRATSSMAVVGAQTIDIAVTGTGITPSDFALSTTTITIPDGMTTGTVTFTIVDDIDIEGTETAIVTISNPSTGITLGRTTTQNIVITDNDSAPIPTVNLSVSANTGTETAGTVITVTATSSMAVVGDQTIDIDVAGAGITPSDFALSNSTITIPDGMTAGTVTFTIVDDIDIEGTETAIVTISNPSTGIALGRTTTQNIVIIDNDSAPIPTVNLSVSSNTGTEADETIITVRATSSMAVVGDQTIDIGVTGTGIMTSDFTLSTTTITIPDGMTTGIVTFTIVDDALVEGTETAIVTISNPSAGITLGMTTTQNVIIEDNDALILCTIEAGDDEEITQGQEVQLNATASGNGTFVWTPSIGLTNTNIANPIANPDQTTTYTVVFTSDQGCVEEDTVTVYVEAQEEDQTRYGFSPDGDGINEYWEIYNIENYPDNKVSIYNRWGDIVFEVEGYNNTSRVFRGIANRKRSLGGDKLPEGTYFFNIKIEGSHNLKKQTGFLVLKR
ncbi:gliding motility-associated C-terminal domain-containing protein [Aquimarina spinulae]|uniref:T9SS type B sorting domain-containing protein n=2 Tax=Aquimarina spinulae TaxID=1192023 RepID=UPI000D552160|nr:gliding motility-associated C-terminal domain-containing protein [Aquimarina spinulae]